MSNWKELCQLKSCRSEMSNGGWAYDAYPDLETLDAHSRITIADLKGPGVITCIHSTQHFTPEDPNLYYAGNDYYKKALAARGILLEIYYNDVPTPAVRVPLADFFGDGCGGKAVHFGNKFIEKAPESYNCFIPMPFEKTAKVILINETDYNYNNYSFVEYTALPEWDDSLGYFHATWERTGFQLTPQTKLHALSISGNGHLLGRTYSICTDEPFFDQFHFVMEANNEFRIDGEVDPSLNYLGTEDSFSFSWGFQKEYNGPYAGMNYINCDNTTHNSMLSIYRFMENNVIRFQKSLDLTINWSQEKAFLERAPFMNGIKKVTENGGGWVDYALTSYWYQKEIGYPHKPMLPLAERCRPFLKENPQH